MASGKKQPEQRGADYEIYLMRHGIAADREPAGSSDDGKRPRGAVMIDAYQNAPGHPLAAPYAVRAFPKAPVSTPVLARELKKGLRPDRLNLKNIFHRLDQYGDLWADFWTAWHRLEDAVNRSGPNHLSNPRTPTHKTA